MIALGWTRRGSALPAPCRQLEAGDLALVAAPREHAQSARDRFALQCACAAELTGFLPAAPVEAIGADDALRWTFDHADAVSDGLEWLGGRIQASLSCERLPRPAFSHAASTGASWLRDKALRQKLDAAETARLIDVIQAAFGPETPCVARAGPRRITIDILVPDRTGRDVARCLGSALCADLPGVSQNPCMTLVSPLPAYAFTEPGRGS